MIIRVCVFDWNYEVVSSRSQNSIILFSVRIACLQCILLIRIVVTWLSISMNSKLFCSHDMCVYHRILRSTVLYAWLKLEFSPKSLLYTAFSAQCSIYFILSIVSYIFFCSSGGSKICMTNIDSNIIPLFNFGEFKAIFHTQ